MERDASHDSLCASSQTFESFDLSDKLLKGIYSEMGFQRPSRIQEAFLPMILNTPYQHIIAQAQNGYGKTVCFVLGMLNRVNPNISAPQAICVCPTRELALQVQDVLTKIGKYTSVSSICAVRSEVRDDSRHVIARCKRDPVKEHVVIGTPGTLKRWISLRILSCRFIKVLVFDEADHMLDQDGFQDDSLRILRAIKKDECDVQILLFSATYNERVKEFAMTTIPDANRSFMEVENLPSDVIKQYKVKCPDELAKIQVVKDTIFPLAEKSGQTIIFVRTRESARRLHEELEEDGYKCTSISSDLSPAHRDIVINEFREGLTRILISTDVLARGFDQAQVSLVVNFDLPVKPGFPNEPNYEVYLHRIGRSGRFGRRGAAFNFICSETDEDIMNQIETHFQNSVTEVPWDKEDDFEAALREAGLA